MTQKQYILLAAAGSFALLGGAFIFQLLGYPPCKMCIWQRWPHAVAILIGIAALWRPQISLLILGALAALTTSVIGFYHAGVEQGWFEGPTTCTSGSIDGLTAGELLDQIMAAPLIRCDEIAWSLLGLSMAGWNAIISLVLAGIWILAIRRAQAS